MHIDGVLQRQNTYPVLPPVKPKNKMRSLAWQKLPMHIVQRSSSCVWRRVLSLDAVQPDFSLEEEWFCQKKVAAKKDDSKQKKQPTEVKEKKQINPFTRMLKCDITPKLLLSFN